MIIVGPACKNKSMLKGNKSQTISLEAYLQLLDSGQLYEGYVEDCGYAYYEAVPVSTYVNRNNLNVGVQYLCKLRITQEDLQNSSKQYVYMPPKENDGFVDKLTSSAMVATAALLVDDAAGVTVVDDLAIPFIWLGVGVVCLIDKIFDDDGHEEFEVIDLTKDPLEGTSISVDSKTSFNRMPPIEGPDNENHAPQGGGKFVGIVLGLLALKEEWRSAVTVDSTVYDKKNISKKVNRNINRNLSYSDMLKKISSCKSNDKKESVEKIVDMVLQSVHIEKCDNTRIEKPVIQENLIIKKKNDGYKTPDVYFEPGK